MKRAIFMVAVFIVAMAAIWWIVDAAEVDAKQTDDVPFVIECTAYCNPHGNLTYSGKQTIPMYTLAGRKDWLGAVGYLYEVNDDGTIGDFITMGEFSDCGFGHDPDGDGIGSIQDGSRIDLYVGEDRQFALQWGVKKVYLKIVRGVG